MKGMVLALMAGLALSAQGAQMGDLDGTQWKLRPQGAKALLFWKADKLSFDKNLFSSVDGAENGFRPSPYVAMEESGKVTWSSAQTNGGGEQIQWQGTRIGNEMQGTYTVLADDGKVKTLRWKATLESAQQPQESGGPARSGNQKLRRATRPHRIFTVHQGGRPQKQILGAVRAGTAPCFPAA